MSPQPPVIVGPPMTRLEMVDRLAKLIRFARRFYPGGIIVSGLRGMVRNVKESKDTRRYIAGKKEQRKCLVVLEVDLEAGKDLKRNDGDVWFVVRMSRKVQDRMDAKIKLPHETTQRPT